jgi:hypothetical protein
MSVEIIGIVVGSLTSVAVAIINRNKLNCFKTYIPECKYTIDIVETYRESDSGWPGEGAKEVKKSSTINDNEARRIAAKWIKEDPENTLIEIVWWFHPSLFKLTKGYWDVKKWKLNKKDVEIKNGNTNGYRTLSYCAKNCIAKDFLNEKFFP